LEREKEAVAPFASKATRPEKQVNVIGGNSFAHNQPLVAVLGSGGRGGCARSQGWRDGERENYAMPVAEAPRLADELRSQAVREGRRVDTPV
jgi:hypothetical protein